MPPKRKGRTTRAKPKIIVELSPEDQRKRDQVDLLLKDFEKQCELTIKEMWREKETIAASINTMYKLELMKLPQEVKDMKWDDYYSQAIAAGENPLALSEAITDVLEDSICGKAEAKVSEMKTTIETTTKKRGRKKMTEKEPATATRSSSRNRTALMDSTNIESSAKRPRRAAKNAGMTTPANSGLRPNVGKTPLITPKFDTSNLSRTVSRVARPNEVLVSLSGSPVVPTLAKAKKVPKSQENNALIPLGGGETLNVPMGVTLESGVAHLDDEQIERLEELQRSLAKMLKMKKQNIDL